MPNATVLVLGDIGRSPRMQNHVLSLASHGFQVNFIGYQETSPPKELTQSQHIRIHPIKAVKPLHPDIPFIFFAIFKVVFQIFQLLYILLFTIPRMDYLLVQNPPSIPTLAVAQVVSCFRRAKLVIDWHNYGYTILALKLDPHHTKKNFLLTFSTWFEHFFGKNAFAHFCVSKAMAHDLNSRWKLNHSPIVLYDKGPKRFRRLELKEIHTWLKKLENSRKNYFCCPAWEALESNKIEPTLLTQVHGGKVHYREGRPMVLVSSTSWTEDEDFTILLDALEKYEAHGSQHQPLPRLLVFITGKGPLKAHYEKIFEEKTPSWEFIHIKTVWLEAEEYPLILGCADLGISLHTSSSGVDLPMKVVDMLAAGLPVATIDYQCIDELVVDNTHGFVFSNANDLFLELVALFEDYPHLHKLGALKHALAKEKRITWEDHWEEVAFPVFST